MVWLVWLVCLIATNAPVICSSRSRSSGPSMCTSICKEIEPTLLAFRMMPRPSVAVAVIRWPSASAVMVAWYMVPCSIASSSLVVSLCFQTQKKGGDMRAGKPDQGTGGHGAPTHITAQTGSTILGTKKPPFKRRRAAALVSGFQARPRPFSTRQNHHAASRGRCQMDFSGGQTSASPSFYSPASPAR